VKAAELFMAPAGLIVYCLTSNIVRQVQNWCAFGGEERYWCGRDSAYDALGETTCVVPR